MAPLTHELTIKMPAANSRHTESHRLDAVDPGVALVSANFLMTFEVMKKTDLGKPTVSFDTHSLLRTPAHLRVLVESCTSVHLRVLLEKWTCSQVSSPWAQLALER